MLDPFTYSGERTRQLRNIGQLKLVGFKSREYRAVLKLRVSHRATTITHRRVGTNMGKMQPDQQDVVFDSRMRVVPDEHEKSAVAAPSWRSAAAAGEVKPLDAHHKMLHEGAVLSSHLKNYENCITKYMDASKRFFSAADDFIISTGYPSKFRPQLTDAGAKAASAVATAAAAEATRAPADTPPAEAPAGPAAESDTTATGGDATGANGTSSSTAPPSAFASEAEQPALPLQGPLGGVHVFPAVPGTPVLAAGGGLTEVVPDDILVPSQHQQLFRWVHSAPSVFSVLETDRYDRARIEQNCFSTVCQSLFDSFVLCATCLVRLDHHVMSAHCEQRKTVACILTSATIPIACTLAAPHLCMSVHSSCIYITHKYMYCNLMSISCCCSSLHRSSPIPLRHDEQRRLIAAGRDDLAAAFSERLLPALQLWGATYDECKLLLPQVERMRLAANKARGELERAKAKVGLTLSMSPDGKLPLSDQHSAQQHIEPAMFV